MLHLRHFAAPAILGAALFVGGCAHERHEDIPLTATEIGEGKESVFYQAPYDGRVYVADDTSGDMLYQGELRRGQMVRVDAKDNKILVDNKTAVERDLVNDHRFKIYFERDERARREEAAREAAPAGQTTIVAPSESRTTVTTDPDAPRTKVQVEPAEQRAREQTTITTDQGSSRTTVTTPDAQITTDPDSQRTTVQPR